MLFVHIRVHGLSYFPLVRSSRRCRGFGALPMGVEEWTPEVELPVWMTLMSIA